ncbi:Protein NLRC5 [Stylophora pistillata]|uniref:Protein NLRC5 n=1 Tax=Stylophora pistillata TaxID=50429 RepID=A0A2B4S533_STYPI|nr:Protein NLRC5 [Stylophora pistillata]
MQHGRKPVQYIDLERKECPKPHGQRERKRSVEDLDSKREKRLRQYGQISGNQIKHSQEIFLPTDGKHPESVLVTGKAGIGKTLFCQKLIRDWADNKLFQSIANTDLPDFKFAYLLTFRLLNLLGDSPVTLKDILNRSSVLDHHSDIDDSLSEYIVDHPEEVLVIIDGYDECLQRDSIASDSHEEYPNNAIKKMPVGAVCAKLIKRKILRGSVVMITSRPDESDKMKDKHIHFDRYVEITGFSEPQVKEYIGKFFKNREGMKNAVLYHITKNVNLVSFAHIPVLCFLMCSYFEYTLQHSDITNPLPVKASDLYDEVVKMFVQIHDKNKRLPLEVTLDELSKLAAQLLRERSELTDVDCTALSFLFHVFGALDAEGESEVNEGSSKRRAKWKLTKLDLSYNQITDAGVVSLCQALQTPTCKLTTLNLMSNQLTDAGVISLCQALHTPTCTLTTLHLNANQITNGGVVSLCQALQTPTCKLTTLDLSHHQITDAGVVSLCQVLQTPTCELTTLFLRCLGYMTVLLRNRKASKTSGQSYIVTKIFMYG